MPDKERDLIRRAKKGDAAAFAALYDRHYDAVYRYCNYRVGDVALAQDLAGEVFVRMVEKLETFKSRGRPLLSWLYTIARNLIIDRHRREGQITRLPLDEGLTADAANPVRDADRRILSDCLQTALEYLTDDQRDVILLKFMGDHSNAETAQVLEKTEGAVKSLQHRALAALRRALEKERCYET